jgi:hypothetical protein
VAAGGGAMFSAILQADRKDKLNTTRARIILTFMVTSLLLKGAGFSI